eukprot:TRINITY_DN13594_c0_g1_i1.p1 TRINITY_DN13594_c0_g1~~TRINITY_DN13594_c0_g1_i1.p1  ORF type:complete len:413 (-),score=93.92 TRINITY_DN13594_c0_g1_i1:915-2153(-)
MSKQLLISSRHPQGAAREVQIGVSGGDGTQIGGWVGSAPSDTGGGAVGGSYKSVLLCDRPANLGGMVAKPAPTGPPAFVSRVHVDSQVGLTAPKDMTVSVRQAPPKPALLANRKHKRWLKALSRLKVQLAEEQEDQQRYLQDRKEKFTRKLAKARHGVRAATATSPVPSSSMESSFADAGADLSPPTDVAQPATAPAAVQQQLTSRSSAKNPTNRKVGGRRGRTKQRTAKPVWALSEEEARAAEAEQENEADDLIDFATSLDYDKYIQDSEVQAALKVLLNRVYEIEQTAVETEQQDQPGAAAAATEALDQDNYVADALAQGAERRGDWKSSFVNAWKGLKDDQRALLRKHFKVDAPDLAAKEEGWDARQTSDDANVKKALGSGTMRSIHSRASVRSVLQSLQQMQQKRQST